MRVSRLLLLVALVAAPLHAQWTALGAMDQPSRDGDSLRFQNAQATAVFTALGPEIVRVRVARPGTRDDAYAVINRNFGDAGATFSVEPARSTIATSALRVSIQHAPFRISFASATTSTSTASAIRDRSRSTHTSRVSATPAKTPNR